MAVDYAPFVSPTTVRISLIASSQAMLVVRASTSRTTRQIKFA